jgi:hypothetical protein
MNRVFSLWTAVIALALFGAVPAAHAADKSPKGGGSTASGSSGSSDDAASSGSSGGSGASSASSSAGAASGKVCITDTAKQKLEACPGGPQLHPRSQGKQPEMSFHSKVEELKKGDKKIGVGSADVSLLAGFRDQRQSALKQRVLALLITEIQQL